jgi:Tfp pilus assembly protein PilF
MTIPGSRSEKPSRAQRRRARVEPKGRSKLPTNTVWVLVIFGCAFLMRLIYLIEIDSIPLFHYLAGDARTYDEWAQRIAAGDWLGTGVFYQAPLYPYFLGTLQLVFGHNLWLIRFLQIILGALSCALLFLAGSKLFSRRAGIAAGLILAFYAPAIFFDVLIEKTILDLVFLSLIIGIVASANPIQHWAKWLALGALLGLLGLSRENALVLSVVLAVWIAVAFPERPLLTRAAWLGLFLAGLLLVLFPVGLRNLTVGGEFKLTTSQFGTNFYIGNNRAADGSYGSIAKMIGEPQLEGKDARRLSERALGRSLTAGEVSDYWFQKAREFIRASPVDWLRLLMRKWLLVWNAREVEDSDDFYVYQQWSWLLRLLASFSHFGILAPLAAVGVFFSADQWRRLWVFYGMMLSLALSVAVFYVFGRYRFPLVPLLVLFAGAAVAQLMTFSRERNWRRWRSAAIVLLITAVVVNWPLFDVTGPGAAGYNNLSNAFYKQGKVDEATKTAVKAIEIKPDYGVAHYNLGNLYAGQRRLDLAQHHFEEALRIYPNYADVRTNLGQLLAERGDLETGIQYFRKAIELNPSISRAHLNLGVALAKQGRLAEAVGPLREAAGLAPDSAEVRYYLGSVYAAQGSYVAAEKSFNDALDLQPDFVPAHQSLAQLLAMQGKKEQAMRHYQDAVRILKRGQGTPAGR